jgi:ATP-dependent protease Clp ATPase subunit
MIKFRRLRCTFCGKNDSEVSKLVAGPRVYICDKCVAVASRLMEGGSHDDSAPKVEPTIWRKFSARARQLFSGRDLRRMTSYSAPV